MEKTHDEEMAIDLWELISALKKRALIILAACLLDLFVITYKTAKSLDFTEIPAHSSNKLSAHLLSDHI